MKIVFLGTPSFAVPSLRALVGAKGIDVALVVSQPDRALDKKGRLLPTPVRSCAEELGLNFLASDNVNLMLDKLKAIKPDFFITSAFGQMLSDDFLAIAPTLNVHASLLPLYRGASPIQAAILNGDKKTGITIMQTVKKMDAGDILSQGDLPIDSTDTYDTLHDKLSILGAGLLVSTLKQLKEGAIKPVKQDESRVTHTKKITKSCGKIDWNKSAFEIECQIRAYSPWPSAYSTHLKTNEIIKFFSAVAHENTPKTLGLSDITNKNGTILHSSTEFGLYVKCGCGVLQITSLQAPSRKILKTSDFLLGNNYVAGDIFENIF